MNVTSVDSQVCGLTGSGEGVAALRQCPALLEILVTLLLDPAPVIATDAALALINLSADAKTVPVVLDLNVSVVNNLYKVTRIYLIFVVTLF